MIGRFPVTKLSHNILEKGVHVAKHGAGVLVARCKMDLQDASLSQFTTEESADLDQIDKAEKTRTWVEGGLKLLLQYADSDVGMIRGQVTDVNEAGGINMEFLMDHDYVLDTGYRIPDTGIWHLASGIENTVIRCDIDVADEIDGEYIDGIRTLYALGFLHQFSFLSGADEKAALNNTITFYENLKDNDRDALIKVLSQPRIDAGNVFLRFLRNSAHKPQHEKDRLIAWVRGRSQIDLPYDDADVIEALEEETDLAALRLRIYNAINDTYIQPVDTENANRIADVCMEKGMRIVAGRFSRALYIDAMLMANAKVIETRHLRESISGLEKLVRSSSLEFGEGTDELGTDRVPRDFSGIGGEMQVIVNLAAEEWVSQAQIEGALSKFKKALREFETHCLEILDTGYRISASGIDVGALQKRGQGQGGADIPGYF
jgi:hypothetical protein